MQPYQSPTSPPRMRSTAAPRSPYASVVRSLVALLDELDVRTTSELAGPTRAAEAKAVIARVLAAFEELDRLDDRVHADPDDHEAEPFSDEAPSSVHRTVSPADVAFGGALELGAVARKLHDGLGEDDLLSLTETAYRKARRAIRAILRATGDLTDGHGPGGEPEVAHALSVRALCTQFRRSLRAPTGEGPDEVLTSLRYAASALATLLTSREAESLRASDRAMLRGLRDRILAWARSDKRSSEGLELLGDVSTTADLLRGINQRQELRAHDAAVLAELRDGLHARELTATFARAEVLRGLDDRLDDLLDRGAKAAALDDEQRDTLRDALDATLVELAWGIGR